MRALVVRDVAGEIGRGQIMEGLAHRGKKVGMDSAERLEQRVA